MNLDECAATCARAARIAREFASIDLHALPPHDTDVAVFSPQLGDVLAAGAARFRSMAIAEQEVGVPPPTSGLEVAVHDLAAQLIFAAHPEGAPA